MMAGKKDKEWGLLNAQSLVGPEWTHVNGNTYKFGSGRFRGRDNE